MEVDLAGQARLPAGDRGAQARQAGGVGGAGPAWSATARLPAVVGRPATSMRSLTATRSPGPGAPSFTIHVAITDQCGIRRAC